MVELYFLHDFNANEAEQQKLSDFFYQVMGAAKKARLALTLPETIYDSGWVNDTATRDILQKRFPTPFKYPSVVAVYGKDKKHAY